MNEFQIILLAAGKGTRMNDPSIPKALVQLANQPLVDHVLYSIKASRINIKPLIVVGYQSQEVIAHLGSEYTYVLQEPQLGTGHAVSVTQEHVATIAPHHLIVLYADMPLISSQTINRLIEIQTQHNPAITLATITVPDFEDWRQCFYQYGRVIRDQQGNITEIVELKNATSEQLAVTEVSPSFFCFNNMWLWDSIRQITDQNAQHEYLLTDLLQIAFQQGLQIQSLSIDPHEGLGVNTPEQLAIIEQYLATQ